MEKLLAQKKLNPRWYERFPRGLPIGIFSLTMAVALLSVFAIENAEDSRQTAQIAQTAQAVASGLERRSNANAAYLRSSAALFATQQMVEAPLFRTFIKQLHLDGRYVGSDGIGWTMKIYRDDIPTVEAIMRSGAAPQFAVRPTPEPGRPFVLPVMFLEPDSVRNRRAIGFDMYSESVRRAAMKAAERSGQPTATGHVVLQQEGRPDGPPGFLVFMPVYSLGADESARKLRGFVYSPFNAQRFLESSIDTGHLDGAGVRLYDLDTRGQTLLAEVSPAQVSGQVNRRPIDIAGHRFLLEIEAPATPLFTTMSVMTLLFGLLVATLLLVLARILTEQAAEDRIALAWFEQQSSIRNSLTRELNHRVKNTLANVLSIISLTRRRATSLPEFADSLEGRIRALSATHDLLTRSDWGTTPISLVIRAELAPYAQDEHRHLVIEGPEVDLAPNDALSLGLAIHELATNAAKYGALSVENGRVFVEWEMAGEDLARIEWLERGGPLIDPEQQRKRGFGTELIEKIVAHELRHPVDLRFEPEGVRCVLLIPVRRRSDFTMRQGRS
ncbi:CHASE domain-containing protein [Novosphingobium sp. MMS21-SN21R]|uniref:CHASE domain-containing protein n=1 Tax=Novosphingobium sp. MMS21-SN21R TaxID=2969298 RepID=UPI0028854B99|nr:CHASE domain-containing protein [Novosphingobium sp. MMS21-SN21R]MDT0509289.1 CHASE domain-containing protein [Novosphingobium sp. MMS21-SN21R]